MLGEKLSLRDFPDSRKEPFKITSTQTAQYNCIAWAFGDDSKWYWPDPYQISYWPENVTRKETVDSFIELYQSIGYEICRDSKYESGYEKIAIFADENYAPTHAARQLEDGSWTSKLGQSFDVEHSMNSITDGIYGEPVIFMKRKQT